MTFMELPEAVRGRYGDWYVRFAGQARHGLGSADRAAWLARVEQEQDNLRAVLNAPMQVADATHAQVQLWEALWRFWEVRGHAQGMVLAGRDLLTEALLPGFQYAIHELFAGDPAVEPGRYDF